MICLAPRVPRAEIKTWHGRFLTHRALASAEPAKSSVTDSQTDVISMPVLRKHAAKARPGSRLSPRGAERSNGTWLKPVDPERATTSFRAVTKSLRKAVTHLASALSS